MRTSASIEAQRRRRAELRELLAREENALRLTPSPPEVAFDGCILVESEGGFAEAIRHEVRRAIRRGNMVALFEVDGDVHEHVELYDVILRRSQSSFVLRGSLDSIPLQPPNTLALGVFPRDGDALEWFLQRFTMEGRSSP